ncbi:MAG: imidazoleglycerol-phosphate dehydratase HisB [Lentisphaeria bacterium]|nr:imidazoleglycerol-phosphate dehydratase HisB [Lentisphaeria bacterium]MBR7128361.1 imidazoleglycerol-phosphate dehydratase HisB [Lentisphaeria bacterium]
MNRIAEITRKTAETDIYLKLNLDGSGNYKINTGIAFLDHMLCLFAKHGFFDLEIEAKGDIEVDFHHTMEDLGIVLGDAINQALGDRKQINRYGSFLLPMDETLARTALDLSNRPYLVYAVEAPADYVGTIDCRLFYEFFQALVNRSGMNLHIDLLRSGEAHHAFEAIFKSFAKSLDIATMKNERIKGVLSTKGVL